MAAKATVIHIPRLLIRRLPGKNNLLQIQAVAVKAATRIFTGVHPVISEAWTPLEWQRRFKRIPSLPQGETDHLCELENP